MTSSHSSDIQPSRISIASTIVTIARPGFDFDTVSAFIRALASLLFPAGRDNKCFGDPLVGRSRAWAGLSGSDLRFATIGADPAGAGTRATFGGSPGHARAGADSCPTARARPSRRPNN